MNIWVLNGLVAILVALNTIFWGMSIREVGGPSMSLGFSMSHGASFSETFEGGFSTRP